MSLIISGGGNLQSKAGDLAAPGYTVPPVGEACVAQRARCQAEDHQQRSPGSAPKQVWPCAHHCFPSPTWYTHGMRLRPAELLPWTAESHTNCKHPDLAIRTQTHTEQPVLPRRQASSQQRISFGHANFTWKSPSWHLLWNKPLLGGRVLQPFPHHHMDGSEMLREVYVQRNWRLKFSVDRREGNLQGSGVKLSFIIISMWLLLQSCAVRVKL